MNEYVDSVDIDVAPQRLFDYLADVSNLPRYMPRLKQAEPVGDGAVEVLATPRLADGSLVEVRGTADMWVALSRVAWERGNTTAAEEDLNRANAHYPKVAA